MKYNTAGLNNLAKEANEFVNKIGFGTNDLPLRIALIHSEISEAFEAYRNDKFCKANIISKEFAKHCEPSEYFKTEFEKAVKDTFEDEIADSIIRLLDLCGAMQIDIEWHITQKMKYNKTRGFKYGGKKF